MSTTIDATSAQPAPSATTRPRHPAVELPPFIVVRPWPDQVIDALGYDVHSRYVELFWLPTLGPTATWLLRRLVAGLEVYAEGYELDLAETATALGLTHAASKSCPFTRAFQRCVMFGVAHQMHDGIAVRRRVPPLAARQIDRLPAHLHAAHDGWRTRPRNAELDLARGVALAATLLGAGDAPDEVEGQLVRLGIPPLICVRSVRDALGAAYAPLGAA
jgi:hypothetical protein